LVAVCCTAAAQDSASNATQSSSTKKKSPPAKPKKTWTNDDVSALRSPADAYTEDKQAETQKAGQTAADSESAQASASSHESPHGAPPALSNPKTADSADKMIAWEERDIAAQEESVDRLKTQLESASPEDRDHLQKLIVQREKVLADTKAERDTLVLQKKDLEKKSAGSAQPPQ
jgi:hypothetical protein